MRFGVPVLATKGKNTHAMRYNFENGFLPQRLSYPNSGPEFDDTDGRVSGRLRDKRSFSRYQVDKSSNYRNNKPGRKTSGASIGRSDTLWSRADMAVQAVLDTAIQPQAYDRAIYPA